MHLMSTSTCTSWTANLILCFLQIKAKNEIKLEKFMISIKIKTTATTNPQEQMTFLLLSPKKNFSHEFALKGYSKM